jgi:hypothetical protein
MRSHDRQRRPGRLWRSPYGKRRARRPTPAGVTQPGDLPFLQEEGGGPAAENAADRTPGKDSSNR